MDLKSIRLEKVFMGYLVLILISSYLLDYLEYPEFSYKVLFIGAAIGFIPALVVIGLNIRNFFSKKPENSGEK